MPALKPMRRLCSKPTVRNVSDTRKPCGSQRHMSSTTATAKGSAYGGKLERKFDRTLKQLVAIQVARHELPQSRIQLEGRNT
jgi:hypothetical protein